MPNGEAGTNDRSHGLTSVDRGIVVLDHVLAVGVGDVGNPDVLWMLNEFQGPASNGCRWSVTAKGWQRELAWVEGAVTSLQLASTRV
ncbi:MAG: hypothetical protein EXS36_06895 [Pedosphaera sp.]|nr:hypothetical protein [Pedosphaera sp.]